VLSALSFRFQNFAVCNGEVLEQREIFGCDVGIAATSKVIRALRGKRVAVCGAFSQMSQSNKGHFGQPLSNSENTYNFSLLVFCSGFS
jgi:NifU-like protein involved in Fe-S cluster formation